MNLKLNSITKAITSLEKALKVYAEINKTNNINHDLLETLKAGVIQNFEFTYELCWKFMKRWIENNISSEIVDGVTRRELFRISAESHLIEDVEEWMKYHKARNSSSHIYDEEIANEIYNISITFLPTAKNFLERLRERND